MTRDPAGQLGTCEDDLDNNEATGNVWPDLSPDVGLHGYYTGFTWFLTALVTGLAFAGGVLVGVWL